MFLTYLWRELRRRRRQGFLVVLGLAVGVGLVMTVGAASAGVQSAQSQVLHSLYGVGTDLTVTKAPTFGSGGPSQFGGQPGGGPRSFSGQRVIPQPGLTLLPAGDAATIRALNGVSNAVGGLSLTSISFSGQFGSGSSAGAPAAGGPAFSASVFTVSGVAISSPTVGPLSGATVTSGSYFSSSDADADVALLSASYAKQQGLKVGSTVTIGGTGYRVVGLVSPPSGGSGSDVYVPLQRAQALASAPKEVNTIYVQAAGSSQVPAVSSEISHRFPSATVTTASTLASEVSSSLGATSSLAGSLGTWLAVIVLVVAFALAAMLTLASVTARVREFGTLKALGWKTRRVVGQIVGEGLALGVVGAAVGVGLGFLGAFLLGQFGGTVKAPVGQNPNRVQSGAFAGGRARFAGAHVLTPTVHTITLHPTGAVALGTVGLAILLAVAGGLLAGALGGWRVARLQPAEALRQVG